MRATINTHLRHTWGVLVITGRYCLPTNQTHTQTHWYTLPRRAVVSVCVCVYAKEHSSAFIDRLNFEERMRKPALALAC